MDSDEAEDSDEADDSEAGELPPDPRPEPPDPPDAPLPAFAALNLVNAGTVYAPAASAPILKSAPRRDRALSFLSMSNSLSFLLLLEVVAPDYDQNMLADIGRRFIAPE